MHAFYLLSIWLHILAAATWIGGMLFLVLVLVPVVRRQDYREVAAPLVHRVGVRFRWVGWICLGLLILSGVFNLIYRGVTWADVATGQLWRSPFGQALGLKLFLVATILLISAAHDFIIGPRATALWQADPAAPAAQRLRRQAGWLGRLNLLLALAVVALGVILVRGWP
jgi:putative copper export protein